MDLLGRFARLWANSSRASVADMFAFLSIGLGPLDFVNPLKCVEFSEEMYCYDELLTTGMPWHLIL
jgi:hypothetical protein